MYTHVNIAFLRLASNIFLHTHSPIPNNMSSTLYFSIYFQFKTQQQIYFSSSGLLKLILPCHVSVSNNISRVYHCQV